MSKTVSSTGAPESSARPPTDEHGSSTRPLSLALRARPWRLQLGALIASIPWVAVAPRYDVALPTANGVQSVPTSSFVMVLVGCAAASAAVRTWFTPLVTERERRWESAHLVVCVIGAPMVIGLVAWLAGHGAMALTLARACLIWACLAVVSLRWLGQERLWLLPCAVALFAHIFGSDPAGGVRSYNWLMPEATGPVPNAILLGCVAVAVISRWATPWRLRRVFELARQGR